MTVLAGRQAADNGRLAIRPHVMNADYIGGRDLRFGRNNSRKYQGAEKHKPIQGVVPFACFGSP